MISSLPMRAVSPISPDPHEASGAEVFGPDDDEVPGADVGDEGQGLPDPTIERPNIS